MIDGTYTLAKNAWVGTNAALVVRKDDLEPQAVTERLGVTPTGTRMPGPDRWRPGGDEAGLWLFECHETRKSLPEQVDEVLDAFTAKADELRALVDEGYNVTLTLFGFVGDGSVVELSSEATARIASLGIPLEVGISTSER
ncbi:DUF4279 domain-containing protein [Streptomyces sp. NBC_01803]|uniref:DUF4279 domain-containing protein n=1 Tax=Streptomyces sp. NBC_01803 TaxID=2975946 RepID=UPI002DD907BE|nr:DUF4279 domain-containing protein [Streptomyces sp. NBC_01803]WSA45447.1 DUF4279 domain-containing protein [Streptomyces sp. NBC_01803]